jgi:RNA polymerase sigma-70 factor (ECF subfamily)
VSVETGDQASGHPLRARAATETDALYAEAVAAFGPALERLAAAYEPDRDRRRDLQQEIHVALWRSFAGFDGRCSLRTWVYRVAHNTATSLVSRVRARTPALVGFEELEALEARAARGSGEEDRERALDERRALARLMELVRRLKPLDRQIILLYLEGVDAAAIGEIAGLSAGNVATKVHRIKRLLARSFAAEGTGHE